jgi:hypothetical protein
MYETLLYFFLFYVYEGWYRKNQKNFSIEPMDMNLVFSRFILRGEVLFYNRAKID